MSGIEQFDAVEHFWCPQLGQTIKFAYCRKVQGACPAPRCSPAFPPFRRGRLPGGKLHPQEREQFLAPPQGRVERVLDTLEKVRRDKESEGK